jgi:hypothetical protein
MNCWNHPVWIVKYAERSGVELEGRPIPLVEECINVGTHRDSNLGKDGNGLRLKQARFVEYEV